MFRIRALALSLFAILFIAFLAAVGAAWNAGAIGSLNSIATIALGGLAIASFFLCVGALDSGEGIALESHWGGLGGGVGGWRLTLPLVFLLAAIFFAGATAVTVGMGPPQQTAQGKPKSGDAQPPAAPTKQKAGSE